MTTQARQNLANAIVAMVDSGKSSDNIAKTVSAYLLDQRSTREIDSVMQMVARTLEKRGQIEATSTSAFKLDSATKDHITKLIKQHAENPQTITMNETIDSSVVGGVRVRFSDQEIDLTLQRKLQYLKGATN